MDTSGGENRVSTLAMEKEITKDGVSRSLLKVPNYNTKF